MRYRSNKYKSRYQRRQLAVYTILLNSSTSRKRLRSDLKTWHVLAHWNTCLLCFYWRGNYVYQIMALGAFCTADASLIVFLIGPEKSRPFTMAFHATIGWYSLTFFKTLLNSCKIAVSNIPVLIFSNRGWLLGCHVPCAPFPARLRGNVSGPNMWQVFQILAHNLQKMTFGGRLILHTHNFSAYD